MVKPHEIDIVFVKTKSGREPVQKWMASLSTQERKRVS